MSQRPTINEATDFSPEAAFSPAVPETPAAGRFENLLLPVVRIERKRFSSAVVAIYGTHVLTGKSSRNLELTETMLDPADDRVLRTVLRSVRTLEFAEVAACRESWNYRKLVANTLRAPTHRFQLISGRQRQVSFTLPVAHVGNVRTALFRALPDRYWQKRPTLVIKWLVFTIVCAVLAVIAGGMFWHWSGPADAGETSASAAGPTSIAPSIAALAAAIFFLVGTWFNAREAHRTKPRWELVRALLPLSGLPTAPTRATRPKRRQPLRSRTLGWVLKLLGLAYWLLIAGPFTDGLHEIFKNNQAGERFVWLLLWAPAPWLIYNGYRLSARRYEPKAKGDTRKPIVFLRPFEDDEGTSLQPEGAVAEIAGVRSRFRWNMFGKGQIETGRFTARDVLSISHPVPLLRMVCNYGVMSSEESLTRYFGAFGPVIAIGKPGERLQSPGAARVYLEDSQWQESIAKELQRAQAVIVQPGLTQGVRWELEHLRDHVAPCRLLFCLVSFYNDPQAYEQLCVMIRQTMQISMPRSVPYRHQPVFVYFDAGWQPFVQPLSHRCPIVWPLIGDAIDLGHCLQPFVQGMHGGDREPPRPPRWVAGMGHRLALWVSAVLGICLVIAAFWGVHFITELAFGGASTSAIAQEAEAAKEVARSPYSVVDGSAVPYRCMAPSALMKKTPVNKLIEHERNSLDGRFSLQIIASPEPEEMSTLAAQRFAVNQGDKIAETKIEVNRTRHLRGADWTEVRLNVRLKNGVLVTEYSQGTSGAQGTVLVVIEVVRSPGTEAAYGEIAEKVLGSFELPGTRK